MSAGSVTVRWDPPICPVCEFAIPNGRHFGIISCGACAAFFRRTVAEEKIFSCTKQIPSMIKPLSKPYICRHCRYLKCIKVGMQLEKVQPRRARTNITFKELSPGSPQGELIGKLIEGTSFIEHERHLAFGPVNCEYSFSSMSGAAIAAKTEFQLIYRYFDSTELTQLLQPEQIPIFTRNAYFLWAQLHAIWLTFLQGGYSANRMCYVDRTYVDINEESVRKIYLNIPGLKNVDTIVRFKMPIYFEFRNLLRLIQRYKVDHVEFMVISHISFINLVISTLQLNKKQRIQLYNYHKKLLADLHKYHTQHYYGEEAIRLGNMTLLIDGIQQAGRYVKEHVALLSLSGYKTTADQKS